MRRAVAFATDQGCDHLGYSLTLESGLLADVVCVRTFGLLFLSTNRAGSEPAFEQNLCRHRRHFQSRQSPNAVPDQDVNGCAGAAEDVGLALMIKLAGAFPTRNRYAKNLTVAWYPTVGQCSKLREKSFRPGFL